MLQPVLVQARSRGGGGGGGVRSVPTPPSGINDIHNFNCLIQERPLILIVSSLASSLRLHQKLSCGMKISKKFCNMPLDPLDIYVLYPPFPYIDSWICMHAPACGNTWLATVIFELVGVSIHFEFVTLLYLLLVCMVCASLHEWGFLYMHGPHQHANSTPPFRKV